MDRGKEVGKMAITKIRKKSPYWWKIPCPENCPGEPKEGEINYCWLYGAGYYCCTDFLHHYSFKEIQAFLTE
jgi:hypothetical protein